LLAPAFGEINFSGCLILVRIQVEPFISSGIQPGEKNHNCDRAVLTAWVQLEKPLKRLSFPDNQTTRLKPAANEKPTNLILIAK
jgi:hypothetical protein